MTAPEKIWATLNATPIGPVLQGTLDFEPSKVAAQIPYIPEALSDARVAAAYEDAADYVDSYEPLMPISTITLLNKTPADAQAALDRMLAQAREEGEREGVKAAYKAVHDLIMIGTPVDGIRMVLENNILALISEDKTNG